MLSYMLKTGVPNQMTFRDFQNINNILFEGIDHIIINEWAVQILNKNDI